ncbi:hypothetical protein FCJ61_30785 [Burkholderia metallica]|nr:hypothetical protein [Burkholderia metallica]
MRSARHSCSLPLRACRGWWPSLTGPATIQSIVVGHDAAQPLVAVGYTAALPNTAGVGGVAVLSCH